MGRCSSTDGQDAQADVEESEELSFHTSWNFSATSAESGQWLAVLP